MNITRIKRILSGLMAALLLAGVLIYSASATAATQGTISFSGRVTDTSPRASRIVNREEISDDAGVGSNNHFIYTKEPVADSDLMVSSVVLDYYSTYALPDAFLLTLVVH